MTDFHDLVIPDSPVTGGVILRRVPDGIETNVPHRATEHSPTGYEWGYGGSGPADLALNVLESALLAMDHQGQRQSCWAGSCYRLAWALHQDYKREVIAGVPHEGTVLYWPGLRAWITEHAQAAGFCLICGEPESDSLGPDLYEPGEGWQCPACKSWRQAPAER